jgi:hypothetical protein
MGEVSPAPETRHANGLRPPRKPKSPERQPAEVSRVLAPNPSGMLDRFHVEQSCASTASIAVWLILPVFSQISPGMQEFSPQ